MSDVMETFIVLQKVIQKSLQPSTGKSGETGYVITWAVHEPVLFKIDWCLGNRCSDNLVWDTRKTEGES